MKISPEEYTAFLATDQIAFTEEVFNTVSPNHKYDDNWHIHCIIEHLKAVEKGEISRLIINMPPRTLKSITVSIAWSAWLLGKDPKRQIMGASFGLDLATEHSVNTRLVMESEWYQKCFPATKIQPGENKQTKFKTTERGHRMGYSVGASKIGQGGDFLIMDDPINPEEALSDTTRNSTNTWIEQSFLPRINDKRHMRAVLVMQRLHENDPTGFLLDKGNWHHLCLPAQFIRKTIIEINNRSWLKSEGEYLDPVRMGNEVLNQALIDMRPYAFSGQMMQNPAPIGGGEFKNEFLQYYDNYSAKFTVAGMNIYILYDPANAKKNKKSNNPDYTAMVVLALANDNNYYILDLVRDRLNPTERVELLFDLHMKWNKKSGKPPRVVSEQYGMMTDNFYIKKKQEELNYRFPVHEVAGSMEKEDRIRRLIPIFESRRIYLPQKIIYGSVDGKSYELVKQFVDDEMVVFPVGRHDDMLDALSRITDEDVRASFPKIRTVYLEAGQSLSSTLNKGYDPQNPMSW